MCWARSATLTLSHLKSLVEGSSAEEKEAHGDANGVNSTDELEDCEVVLLPVEPFQNCAFPNGVRLLDVCDGGASSARLHRLADKVLLDLAPKPIMAAGDMVELLIKSRVGHYIDFRAFDSSYLAFSDGSLRHVPASRADVFQERFISMVEKRLLMRFVNSSLDSALNTTAEGQALHSTEPEGCGTSLADTMKQAGLTDNLMAFLEHAVALLDKRASETPSADGLAAIVKYQKSVVKYNTRTPFLYPNYGSGELSQAFCRACAVHGGTYVLRRAARALLVARGETGVQESSGNDEIKRVAGVITSMGEKVTCANVFSSARLLQKVPMGGRLPNGAPRGRIWRAICVIDGSIVRDDANRVFVVVPSGTVGNRYATVRMRQLDSAVAICPEGFYVLYAETVGVQGCERDVLVALDKYVALGDNERAVINGDQGDSQLSPPAGGAMSTMRAEDDASITTNDEMQSCATESKPSVLWGVVYSRDITSERQGESPVSGLTFVHEREAEPDASLAIAEARRCFNSVMPEAEFFETSEGPVYAGSEDAVDEAAADGHAERANGHGSSQADDQSL